MCRLPCGMPLDHFWLGNREHAPTGGPGISTSSPLGPSALQIGNQLHHPRRLFCMEGRVCTCELPCFGLVSDGGIPGSAFLASCGLLGCRLLGSGGGMVSQTPGGAGVVSG